MQIFAAGCLRSYQGARTQGTRYHFRVSCPHLADQLPPPEDEGLDALFGPPFGPPEPDLGLVGFIHQAVMSPDAVRVVTRQAIAALNKALTCGCRVDEEVEGCGG